jgi:hypothetical protein
MVGDHQEATARRTDELAREVEEVMANRLDGGPLGVRGQLQALEPSLQMKSPLPNDQRGPIGMERLRGQLL